jgi:spore germination protein YaaH
MYGIEKDGSLKRSDRIPDRTALMAFAKRHGIKVFLTLGCNPRDFGDGFGTKARARIVRESVALCATLGFDGVDVDIEELHRPAKETYNKLLADLGRAARGMTPPRRFAVTVASFEDADGEKDSFFDYAAIAALADEVRVMHYNCPWGEPGPLMPREVFARGVAYARSRIPAEKYVAAVPWYGVDWNIPADENEDILWRMTDKETGLSSLNELVANYGGAPVWREPEGELSYSYTAEGKRHEVWVADVRTFGWMVDVVRAAGAVGVYAYQLEYADPACLDVVRRKVRSKP